MPEATTTHFQELPKVDLHRHLEGSLRLRTMLDIARHYGVTVPVNTAELKPLVQVEEHEAHNFRNFLAKFQTLRLFYRTPEIISRITREAIADAAHDGVVYLELIFTPVALGRSQGFSLKDVMDWVVASAGRAAREYGITVRLVASVNRHESVAMAEETVQLAVDRMSAGVCGVDLAGNEVDFPAEPFAGLFRQAKASGLRINVHAGEWAGAASIRYAIEQMGAERIAHGIRIMEDLQVTALARERRIPFMVCLTSNVQTGAVPDLDSHPLPLMYQAGLKVSLHTDDPSISQINLSMEYDLAHRRLAMLYSAVREMAINAAQAIFAAESERQELVERLQKAWA
jgi:adenosine deaminase